MTGSENTKIVFLDCDGVVSPFSGSIFAKPQMTLLKKIVKETGAKIVLSSSWRTSTFGRAEVTKELVANAMPTFIDITPEMPDTTRAVEILTWLEKHKDRLRIVNFVALDDIALARTAPDKEFFGRHAVKTNSHTGLTEEDAALAIKLLDDSNNF